MAQIYVTEETRKKLFELSEREHRTVSDEIEFMVDGRSEELNKE